MAQFIVACYCEPSQFYCVDLTQTTFFIKKNFPKEFILQRNFDGQFAFRPIQLQVCKIKLLRLLLNIIDNRHKTIEFCLLSI